MDKSDKICKVRIMLDRMLPLFRRYYSPRQQLSLDEGMIPTKNRLAIKQYIRDKPVRWGSKSFLLCEAKTGYILNSGLGQEPPLAPPRISWQCCPPSPGELAGHQQEPHAVHRPLLQLRRALPPAEERTGSPVRGQGTRQETEHGRYEFRSRGGLCSIAWKDQKPIHFLSNYHDPRRVSTVSRLTQLTAPQLVVDYTR